MKTKKQQAIDNGDMNRAGVAYSAAYLLVSMAMYYIDKGTDILKSYDLCVRGLKQSANALDRDFDKLNECFNQMIDSKQKQNDLADDYLALGKIIDEFLKVKL